MSTSTRAQCKGSSYRNIRVKYLKLTGTALELCAPNMSSDTLCGQNNYLGMVKETKIGKSAAKFFGFINYFWYIIAYIFTYAKPRNKRTDC